MSIQTMNPPIKWAAKLEHVREVSLLGTADLAFWTDRLKPAGLLPAERDGLAQVMIVAADSRFMGVKFRELSFSVLATVQNGGGRQEAAYLLRAYNSSRLFAFLERLFFSTPYEHGAVGVSVSLPASIGLVKNGEAIFRAAMGTDTSAPAWEASRFGEEGWEGPVFLPETRGDRAGEGKLFFARLHGHTQTFPFLPSRDSVTIRPSPVNEALQALVASHFVAREWAIRVDASHAKSKTYKRAEVLGRAPTATTT